MLKDLTSMFVHTISQLTPTVEMKQQTGVKVKDIPDILIVASKSKSDANKQKRLLMKKYKLVKQDDIIANFTNMIELTSNY